MGIRTIGILPFGIKKPNIGSSSSYCTPQNIAIEVITGGLRLTWTPCTGAETELYVSIDGGAYSLIATTGLTIGTYDYTCDDNHLYVFKLRSKYDTTVLSAPTNLAATAVTGGVDLTWDDTNTEESGYEVWGNINGAGYTLIATTDANAESYHHTIAGGSTIEYKVRAKEGTLPVYSDYSNTDEATTPDSSYLNEGGSGNRAALIDVTGTILWTQAHIYVPPQHLVNGIVTDSEYNYFQANNPITGKYINFDFKAGASKIINEAKVIQTGTQTHGTWKWQGSVEESATPDAGNFVDIGASFTLGGATTQTITTLSANTTGYRHYRLVGVTGQCNTNPKVGEVQFKIF